MAKKSSLKSNTTYNGLLESLLSGKVQNHIIFLKEKALFDDLIKKLADNFLGKNYKPKEQVRFFFTDDKPLEAVMTECDNISFFSEKKIIVLKIVRKPGYRGFTDKEKATFVHYFENSNPDVFFIILDAGEEPAASAYDGLEHKNLLTSIVKEFTQSEFIKWVKSKFADYEISEDTVNYFVQFLNFSFDEITQEIEKLKVYCIESKKITNDDVNLCIGFSKDFSEAQFIEAVFTKDFDKSLQIYEKLALKRDVEIYLLVLLNAAFTAISKLFDSKTSALNGWDLIKTLKLWGGGDKLAGVYKNYQRQINEFKLKSAFDYIYEAEVLFKTSNPDKKTVFTRLISRIISL